MKRINALIRDIQRDPFAGLGKPEALRFSMSGYWSRRIDQEHRLVYKVTGDSITSGAMPILRLRQGLRRLRTPGVAGSGPDHLNAPAGVTTLPNGDILFAGGHNVNGNNRVARFSWRWTGGGNLYNHELPASAA